MLPRGYNLTLRFTQHCQGRVLSASNAQGSLWQVRHSSSSASATKIDDNYQQGDDEEKAIKLNKSETEIHPRVSSNKNPSFPDIIHNVELKKTLAETVAESTKTLTAVGRFTRMFMDRERSGNWWESAVNFRRKSNDYYNLYPDKANLSVQEVGVALLVESLGGAMKLVDADRWVDNFALFKARDRRDIRRFGSLKVDALDFRGSGLNYRGTRFFDNLAHLRYLNVGDCKEFDNFCMTRLNTLSETLEYLDISGTKVTAEGLTYLRLFPNLKWLNVSRTTKEIYNIVPYILEILPPGCTVVVDDDRSALSYGSEIPFLHQSDPAKDHVFDEDPGLGDLVLFEERYGMEVFNPSDVTHVHQLWKTPVVSKTRLKRISYSIPPKRTIQQTFLCYVKKAEEQPPLF